MASYRDVTPAWGFGALSEIVYLRTYSRLKADGTNECWADTVERVVNGCYRMQERHIKSLNLGWNPWKAQRSAQEMFERIFTFKFLPPGRGLWAMGTELTEKRGMFAALNNCAFVSTAGLADDPAKPFAFLMDASMLGIGVGFDIKGAGTVVVRGPSTSPQLLVSISDDREGWVESVALVIHAYIAGKPKPCFDYSAIRPAGEPIHGFGGVASGPEPLRDLHREIRFVLTKNIGQPITVTTIVDLMNLIGRCVVAGNVRRTAEIVFGDPADEEYLDLKNHWWNAEKDGWDGPAAHRASWSWTSNNSVFCEVGMDYGRCAGQTAVNGEPGYAWLENMRAFGRMSEPPNYRDRRVSGGNPCLEQSLESYELCCLVESYPDNHPDFEDYRRTLKFAYLYAKTVTLGQTHWPETNRVMLRNRRIGASMSGIQQFVARRSLHELRRWCDAGYDAIQGYDRTYSDWFAVPMSVKTTSIKPSGTVSLLAGATPGMHWPESLFYIRRMRLSIHSDLIAPLKEAGYRIEPCVGQEDSTVVVEFPVQIDDCGGKLKTVDQVSLWEQVAMAAFLQTHWADNQVSCTVTFLPKEADQIEPALNYHQYSLKGISFLPKCESAKFPQMPYEAITPGEYLSRKLEIQAIGALKVAEDAEAERFCDGESCVLV